LLLVAFGGDDNHSVEIGELLKVCAFGVYAVKNDLSCRLYVLIVWPFSSKRLLIEEVVDVFFGEVANDNNH
jgi:hypothetical protein